MISTQHCVVLYICSIPIQLWTFFFSGDHSFLNMVTIRIKLSYVIESILIVLYFFAKQSGSLLWSKLKIAMLKNPLKKILDPDCYPDHPQYLISSSSSYFRQFVKFSSKSDHTILRYCMLLTNNSTNKQKKNLPKT